MLAGLVSLLGFAVFIPVWIWKKENILDHFRLPLKIILLAVVGLGAYRILYFAAFAHAPAVEANMINYLWPVLIVIFSRFLPGEKVRWFHLAGGLTGFAGLFILLNRNGDMITHLSLGHWLALLAAVEWAIFSVVTRLTKGYSSNVLPVSFLITGLIYMTLHFVLGETGTVGTNQWAFIVPLGILMGFGYFFWDIGMKHGDIQVLAVCSYFTPLISTFWLIVFGKTDASGEVLISAALIFAAALVASQDKVQKLLQDIKNPAKT